MAIQSTFFPYPGAHPIPKPGRPYEPMTPITAPNTKLPVGRSPEPMTPITAPNTKLPVGRSPEPMTPVKYTSGDAGSPVGVPTDRGYVLGGGGGAVPIGQRPYEPLTPVVSTLQQGAPHVLGNTGQGMQLHTWDAGHLLPSKAFEGQHVMTRSDRWAWWQTLVNRFKNARHFTLDQTQGASEVNVSPGEPSGIGGTPGYY
jgi:hypothetical protein